jgi:lipoprotein-releasing system permease protein
MPFSLKVALRFLSEAKGQSALIMGGAAVGIAVMVFLSALISGLQTTLIDQTLGTQAHVVVEAEEDIARPLIDRSAQAVAERVQRPAQRLRSIGSWPTVLQRVRTTPGVRDAAASVNGPGFAGRGAARRSVLIRGIEPASFDRVVPIREKLVAGRLDVGGGGAVIGVGLAAGLGAEVGDRLRLSTAGTDGMPFTVAGIFDLGNQAVNEQWVLVSLPSGQSLLDLEGGVSSIEATVDDIFQADALASAVAARTGLPAESWMQRNRQLMIGLRSQSSSSVLIQVFVMVAVALGIASVLGVSVVQKAREIGILRAMGARTWDVLSVFVIQGLIVGAVGSVVGCGLGSALGLAFQQAATSPDGSPLFPIDLNLGLFARATAVSLATGLAAAVAPARRAARLDPAEVLRNV